MDLPQSISDLHQALDTVPIAQLCKKWKRPPVSTRLLREAYQTDPDPRIREFIASYPLAPSDLLEQMAREFSEEISLLALLGNNPRTPPASLTALLEHPEAAVRAGVAQSTQLSPRQVDTLAEDPAVEVVRELACRSDLKERHMARLATHRDPSVRLHIARQKQLPEPVALVLSADPSVLVRFALALHFAAEEDFQLFLADSDREEVQLALLQRKDLADTPLHSLLLSSHASVRAAARALSDLDEPLLLHSLELADEAEQVALAAYEPLPELIQRALVDSAGPRALEVLAHNPSISTATAQALIDCELSLAAAVLENPVHREAVAEYLAASQKPEWIALLADLEGLPPEVFGQLLRQPPAAGLLAHLAWNQRPVPGIPADLAEALVEHALPCLRVWAISSYPFPRTTLLALAEDDPARAVRKVARRQLAAATTMPDSPESHPALPAFMLALESYLSAANPRL